MTMKIWKNTPTLDGYVPMLAMENALPEEAELAVVGAKKFDVRAMPNLKAIFKCGVGTDNIDFDECSERGVRVSFPSEQTANIIYEETANFTVFLILERLYAGTGHVESWSKYPRPFLGNRVVLLIGQGNIGCRVKSKLSALLTVRSFDTATDDMNRLEPLVREADVISLHIPLIAGTCNWFDAGKLGWMKNGGALVNTARGPIVDENALYGELSAGRITAAFDVYWEEPYRGKLSTLPPHIFHMTPHVASTCEDFLKFLGQDLQTLIDRMKHD
jgi:phosphoglycerate dehydrogenase-like enzyme